MTMLGWYFAIVFWALFGMTALFGYGIQRKLEKTKHELAELKEKQPAAVEGAGYSAGPTSTAASGVVGYGGGSGARQPTVVTRCVPGGGGAVVVPAGESRVFQIPDGCRSIKIGFLDYDGAVGIIVGGGGSSSDPGRTEPRPTDETCPPDIVEEDSK